MGQDTIDTGDSQYVMHFEPGYQFEDGTERYRIGCLGCSYTSAAAQIEDLDDLFEWMVAHTCVVRLPDRIPELWYSASSRAVEAIEAVQRLLEEIVETKHMRPLGFDDEAALQRAHTVLYRVKDVEVRLRGA